MVNQVSVIFNYKPLSSRTFRAFRHLAFSLGTSEETTGNNYVFLLKKLWLDSHWLKEVIT